MGTRVNDPLVVHASSVAVDGKAVLVVGPSGSGKSALCLQLMALGATLVADDRTELISSESGLIARAPETIDGMIEARGV
ncbi:MAG TPA: serine kinase, partial [Rhodobacteraceae bacterium]|nr:serine kinase [Paracoccaceae bacterium]